MNRDKTTKALLALGADPSTRDIYHDLCLQEMVVKMPTLANMALDAFHRIDRLSRKEYFYIRQLECVEAEIDGEGEGRTRSKALTAKEEAMERRSSGWRNSDGNSSRGGSIRASFGGNTNTTGNREWNDGASSMGVTSMQNSDGWREWHNTEAFSDGGEQRSRNFAYVKPMDIKLMNTGHEIGETYLPMPRSLLEEIVAHSKEAVITNETVKRIIKKKWVEFAKYYHIRDMMIYLLYIAVWTMGPIFEAMNADRRGIEDGGANATNITYGGGTCIKNADAWGSDEEVSSVNATLRTETILDWIGMLFVFWYILIEVWEFWSKKQRMSMCTERALKIVAQGEAQYLLLSPEDYINRILDVNRGSQVNHLTFFDHVLSDRWNIVDWLSYIALGAAFVCKQIYKWNCDKAAAQWSRESEWDTKMWNGYQRLWMFGLILAWYKILKYLRAFSRYGPFVRCAFFDRHLHSMMPLVSHACSREALACV
jgi:hypothetical protein